jgi:hypothetical protein
MVATDLEDHLLLSACTMRYRSTVEYEYPMTQNSIHPADEHNQGLNVQLTGPHCATLADRRSA